MCMVKTSKHNPLVMLQPFKFQCTDKIKILFFCFTVTESQACLIALEILPLLLPVRNKKGVVAANFLYNVQEVIEYPYI